MIQKIISIIIFMVIGTILIYPKETKTEEIHIGKSDIPTYQVKLEGAFLIERTFTFFEPKSMSEILGYGLGYDGDVDLSKVNLNEVVWKSRTVVITPIGPVEGSPLVKININQANFKDLLNIPGMTETRAASLIVYREANGHFKSIDDLVFVKNIGPVTLEKIRPHITI
jgi:competence protein ComEA